MPPTASSSIISTAPLARQQIAADPAAYGLTSAGPCPAAQATQCITNRDLRQPVSVLRRRTAPDLGRLRDRRANMSRPSSTAPLTLQAPSRPRPRHRAPVRPHAVDAASTLTAPRDGDMPTGMRFFVVGDTFQRDVDDERRQRPFDIDGVGITAGVEFGLPGGVAGARRQLHPAPGPLRRRLRARSTAAASRSAPTPASASPALFGQGHLGYGRTDHEIERTGVIDDMDARARTAATSPPGSRPAI